MGIISKILSLFGYSKTKSDIPITEYKYDSKFEHQAAVAKSKGIVDVFGDPTDSGTAFAKAEAKILGNFTPGRQNLSVNYLAETDEYVIVTP